MKLFRPTSTQVINLEYVEYIYIRGTQVVFEMCNNSPTIVECDSEDQARLILNLLP